MSKKSYYFCKSSSREKHVLPELGSLFRKVKCNTAAGQRIKAIPRQPHPSSILQIRNNSQPPITKNRVKFDLPPSLGSSGHILNTSHENDSDNTVITTTTTTTDYYSVDAKQMVKKIPRKCLLELVEIGTLDRILSIYPRRINQLIIDSHLPLRSLYFHSLVMHHLSNSNSSVLDVDEAVAVCEAAVVLNNASLKNHSDASLQTFLSNDAADRNSTLNEWRSSDIVKMEYALHTGQTIANLDKPILKEFLSQHIAEHCVVKPTYDYMFQEYLDTGNSAVPLITTNTATLQFQIYNTVREIMSSVYGNQPPLAYIMAATLFAIIETNEKIVQGIADKAEMSGKDITYVAIRTTVDEADSSKGNCQVQSILTDLEVLDFLDLELAAALGYLLAQRFHSFNIEDTNVRAKLGALALGVDTEDINAEVFPPRLPLQDSPLHEYVNTYVSTIYRQWPHGFAYMVIEETVYSYNNIIQTIRSKLTQS